MAVHDWRCVNSGLFHNFQQMWSVQLTNLLNLQFIPAGYFALLEQRPTGIEPDSITNEADDPPNQNRLGIGDRGRLETQNTICSTIGV